MPAQTYTLDWNQSCSLAVKVDRALLTDEVLYQINDFWSNPDDRIQDENGDLLAAVLKLLFIHVIEQSFRVIDVIGELKKESPDGWCPLDGSYGLELVKFSEIEIDTSDIEIELKLEKVLS